MPLSDTDIQRIVAELQRQSIGNAARLVAEQARTKTGVIAGGPYGLASFDGTGRATWAGTIGALIGGSTTSAANDTTQTVTWADSNSWGYNLGGVWNSTTPTRLYAPITGYYAIFVYATFDANATGYRRALVRRLDNTGSAFGTIITATQANNGSGSQATSVSVSIPAFQLDAGESIDCQVRQTSGGALALNASSWFGLSLVGA
jgi:hypothetical protein